MLMAHPQNRIPLSELKKYTTLSIDGEFVSPFDLEGDWQSFTARRMLGDALDSIFREIDALADKLVGLVNTGSSAIDDYLKFFAKRVSDLLAISTKFTELMQRLLAYTLRGSFLLLKLPLDSGGMEGFVTRFNQASTINNTTTGLNRSGGIPMTTTNDGIAKYHEKGIMMGMIVLYGIPSPAGMKARLTEIAAPAERAAMQKRVEGTEQAIRLLLKMFGLE
jgi:hypothetical protein